MSRKPIDGEAAEAKGRLPGRRGIWTAIRELKTFTAADLRLRVPHVTWYAAHNYMLLLLKGGFIEAGPMIEGQSRSCAKVRQYTLIRDIGVDPPRLDKQGRELPPTGQQLMWLAMKILGWFTPEELAAQAGIDAATAEKTGTWEVQVQAAAARDYVRKLYRAGYLQRSGGERKEYRLVRNTGGHAPMVQRAKVVFDPNLNRIVWHEDLEP
jgi:hypothetical protein